MPTYARGLVEYEVDPDRGVYRYREPLLPEEASRALLELLEYYVETGRGLRAEEAWAAARRLGLEEVYERYKAAIDYYLHRSIEGLGPLEPLALDHSVDTVSVMRGATRVRWNGRWLRAEPPLGYGDVRRLVEGAGRPLGRLLLLPRGLRALAGEHEILVWRPPRPGGDPRLAAALALLLERGRAVIIHGPPGSGGVELAQLVLRLLEGRRIVVVDDMLLLDAPGAVPAPQGVDPFALRPEVLAVRGNRGVARLAVEAGLPVLAVLYKPLEGAAATVEMPGTTLRLGGAPVSPEGVAELQGETGRYTGLLARAQDLLAGVTRG